MHTAIETLLSSRRRRWLLLTAIATTTMFTVVSMSRLAELVHEQLPPETASHGMFERAERSIISHFSFSGDPQPGRPLTTVEEVEDRDQPLADARQGTTATTKPASTAQEKTKVDQGSVVGGSTVSPQAKHTGQAKGGEISSLDKAGLAAGAARTPCEAAAVLNHTDYWGDALVWGDTHRVRSAEECCKRCAQYVPEAAEDEGVTCNVWVWCGDKQLCGDHHRECWLKHLAHPDGTAPASEGPTVGWTTGIMPRTKKNAKNERDGEDSKESPEERKYHVVITAQGSAVHWQSRVHYYWFLKIKTRCEEEATRQGGNACHMGGFTRVLHSGKPDELMNEIPTFVAQPLPPEKIPDGYVVLNRPYALLQWIQQAKIREKYVLMSEPDHIWLKPMPNLMQGRHAAAFPFFYIEPTKQEFLPIVRRYLGPITRLQAEEIAPIGNAPTLLAWDDLVAAAPVWYNMSLAIHADPEANKAWGWVQEMFAFTMSLYEVGVRDVGLHPKMMSQPPFDEKLEPWYLLHYTYGMDYTNEGVFTPGKYGEWRFDKREYAMAPPRQNLQEPPEACQNELVRYLIQAINEATQVIPGWQEYAATGTAKELWDGKTFA